LSNKDFRDSEAWEENLEELQGPFYFITIYIFITLTHIFVQVSMLESPIKTTPPVLSVQGR